jgi:hypothetical protein
MLCTDDPLFEAVAIPLSQPELATSRDATCGQ